MKHSRGFTLIELIVTMTILAIIVTTAAPSFNRLMRNVEIDGGVSKIRSILSYARTQAVDLQGDVMVCVSDNGATCSGQTDWSLGVIVFHDEDGSAQFNDDGDAIPCETGEDCLLRVWEESAPQGAQLTAKEREAALESAISLFAYSEEGDIGSLEWVRFEMRVLNCGVGDLRTIEVNRIGRVQVMPAGDC